MSEETKVLLPFTATPTLDLETSASQIEVLPVEPGGEPRIESGHDTEKVGIDVKVVDGVVQLRFGPGQTGWRWFAHSHARLKVYVPKSVRARIRNDMGEVRVSQLEGCDLEVSTSAGQIRLEHVRGRLKLHADAGEIRAEHIGGTLSASCNAGSARLGIDHLDAGEHQVRSNMGSVRIELATGLDVRIEAKTVMGSTRVKYPSNAEAKAVLKLETELGSVRVNDGGVFEDARRGDWADWRRHWAEQPWPPHHPDWGHGGNPFGRLAETARAMAMSVFQPPAQPVRDEELRRILSMVQAGQINAEQAEKLIRAIEGR